jgi:hypothetical protein
MLVPVAAVVFVVVVAPASWRLWLALALALWWLVGIIVAREGEESLRDALLYAPLAPFVLVVLPYSLLSNGREAWTLKRLRAELERIGADDVRVDGIWTSASISTTCVRATRTSTGAEASTKP